MLVVAPASPQPSLDSSTLWAPGGLGFEIIYENEVGCSPFILTVLIRDYD